MKFSPFLFLSFTFLLLNGAERWEAQIVHPKDIGELAVTFALALNPNYLGNMGQIVTFTRPFSRCLLFVFLVRRTSLLFFSV